MGDIDQYIVLFWLHFKLSIVFILVNITVELSLQAGGM